MAAFVVSGIVAGLVVVALLVGQAGSGRQAEADAAPDRATAATDGQDPDGQVVGTGRAADDTVPLLPDHGNEQLCWSGQQWIDIETERLVVANAGTVDPVLNRAVAPSSNDIERQLRAGVAPADVVIRPAIPFGVGLSPERRHVGTRDVLVFIDTATGDTLGWVGGQPARGTVDGQQVEFYDTVVELAPTTDGAPMALYVRPLAGRAPFDCPPGPGEQPLAILDFDEFGGATRVGFDLHTGRLRPLASFED